MPPRHPSRPRRPRSRDNGSPEATASGEAAPQPDPPAQGDSSPPANTPIAALAPQPQGRKRIYAGILVTFAVINGVILFLLRGVDDELKWSQELRVVDDRFKGGDAAGAASDLVRFGERWPNARGTFGFNEKAGRYFAAAGEWARAAEFYERAASLRPGEKDIAASAGEAHWQAGNRERAVELFKREILAGNADNDLANLRLAQRFIEERDYLRAGEFLQAVRDRGKFATELKAARDTIEREVLEPARHEAALAR